MVNDLKQCVKRNTGLTLDKFNDLLSKLPSLQGSFQNPSHAEVALYMYLMKMRTGQPSEDIGRVFSVTRVTVERQCSKVREAMKTDFVFENVNYVRSRDELLACNTDMGRGIFLPNGENKVILICDGTYIYVDRSSNYEFQKKTYTSQKKRNFVKIMMVVTCNGTIVYAFGPYPASQNDATILKSIFDRSDAFDHLQNHDILLLDRGFRDCVQFVESKGLEVKMPALLQLSRDKKQLSTAEANKSRLVTALRFSVEARNGHLKTIFKIFDMVWGSLALKHLQDDVRNCTAIINLYFREIESNRGFADEISRRMLNRLDTPNSLSEIVDRLGLQKKIRSFEPFDDFDSLPALSGLHLIYISLGRYQIKQAASYCQEHLKQNGSNFALFVCPENLVAEALEPYADNRNPKLFFAKFSSRFRSAAHHKTFVLIDCDGYNENAVLGYCCDCYNGLRTIGCCSHVMSIIWYSLHIKDRNVPKPAAFLDDYFGNIV